MTRAADATPRDWFRAWFGDEYLAIYPHRDIEEARRAVRLYLDRVPPSPGSVLDLACGAGRHLRELLAADEEVRGALTPEELEACFDPTHFLRHVDAIYDRVFDDRGSV